MKNNPLDPIDYQVDEMLKMAKSGKFEPGIYNFCDRWCEKCPDRERCFLYAQEVQRKIKHLVSGEDPDDWETVFSDIRHNFAITKRLLERGLREQGLDPNRVLKEEIKNWDDDVHCRYDNQPCLIKAREYAKKTSEFLQKFHQGRFKYFQQLGAEVSFDDIKDEIETISWYHTMLPTKIWRAFYEKESWQREEDQELKELIKRDLPKYIALVEKCIAKSKKAWQNLETKREEFASIVPGFLNLLDTIKKEFKILQRKK